MAYQIVRFYSDSRGKEEIKQVNSLKEAQEHCQDDDTHGTLKDGTKWFDGYTKL